MSSQAPPPPLPPPIQIDIDFLLRQVASLVQVKRRRRTWNELGEAVLRDFMKSYPLARVVRHDGDAPVSREAAHWRMAKSLMHEVLATQNPQHDAIRKRLGNLQEPSTPRLLSTLGLWLAGMLGISVSVTGPLVAVMLYGVAEAGGDWDALGDF